MSSEWPVQNRDTFDRSILTLVASSNRTQLERHRDRETREVLEGRGALQTTSQKVGLQPPGDVACRIFTLPSGPKSDGHSFFGVASATGNHRDW